jgi:hypothetical protein
MSYVAHTETKENMTLEIVNDEDPMNPRTEFDHVGKMVCFHGHYDLGDKHNFADPDEFHESSDFKNAVVKLPLYLLDHSGISMSTGSFNDPWDSGQVGYILMSREAALENWGKKRLTKKVLELAKKCLEAEVEEYNQYLTGDVYGYIVKDADGEQVDSCWGFYGFEYAKEEGKSALDSSLESFKTNNKECSAAMAL